VLQAILDTRDRRDDAEMRRQVNRILDAVKAVVPQELCGPIVEKLDQVEQPTLGVDDETDYDDDVSDPADCDDMNDAR
jgi:hypothetical protein